MRFCHKTKPGQVDPGCDPGQLLSRMHFVPVPTYWVSPSVILHVLRSPHVSGRVMPLKMKVKVNSTLARLTRDRYAKCGQAALAGCRFKFNGALVVVQNISYFLMASYHLRPRQPTSFFTAKELKMHSYSHAPPIINKSESKVDANNLI